MSTRWDVLRRLGRPLALAALFILGEAFAAVAWAQMVGAPVRASWIAGGLSFLPLRLFGFACIVVSLDRLRSACDRSSSRAPAEPTVLWKRPPFAAPSHTGEMTPTQSWARGHVIAGRYELLDLIGRGGMGEVYEGRRLKDGFEVAIKLLHPHLVVRPGTRERFRREAWLASHVSPAYVARVFEFGATPEGTEYIVMERLRGADLALVLERRGRLTLEEVVPMVERIAEALEAAHAVGIVHRDLKPENVFLAGDEDVRLLDFGVARHEAGAGLTLANEVLGTPGYMAPEQACGRPSDVGPHTDVFALGAIVYRCLTGRAAFPSRTACAAIYEAMHLVPEAPSSLVPELGPDIDIVVARALAKASERRYPRARAFAEELRRAATARRSGRRLIAFRGGVDAEDTKLERPNRETAA